MSVESGWQSRGRMQKKLLIVDCSYEKKITEVLKVRRILVLY